jgi:ribosomal protein S27AE
MVLRINVGATTDVCDIPDCGRPGTFMVGRPDTTRVVCGRCMEELVTVSGWKTLGSTVHPATLPFDDRFTDTR